MVLRRNPKPVAEMHDLPLSLRSADGNALHTFPAGVINSLRHMENTLSFSNTLPKHLAIVAALGGEGVTYTALALATMLAHDLQARICVVEVNWYTPGMHARLSEPVVATPARRRKTGQSAPTSQLAFAAGPGIAGVLTGASSLNAALIPTGLPNLTLLPAGELSPALRPSMARGEALKHCLAQLDEQFDHLVLDIPAIFTTTDAIALASLSQGCCLVVRQGVTPVSSVRRALDALTHLNILGVILNQAGSDMPRWLHRLIPQE